MICVPPWPCSRNDPTRSSDGSVSFSRFRNVTSLMSCWRRVREMSVRASSAVRIAGVHVDRSLIHQRPVHRVDLGAPQLVVGVPPTIRRLSASSAVRRFCSASATA